MTAEPPLMVESREELVCLLGEACEIEHGLMCEYLYAQFSLKRAAGEGLTPEQLARVQAWEATLIDVIKQEMLHLALAANILTAVGTDVLSRWRVPRYSRSLTWVRCIRAPARAWRLAWRGGRVAGHGRG